MFPQCYGAWITPADICVNKIFFHIVIVMNWVVLLKLNRVACYTKNWALFGWHNIENYELFMNKWISECIKTYT